jgi:cytochrome c oxidase assembly protein subunit 15
MHTLAQAAETAASAAASAPPPASAGSFLPVIAAFAGLVVVGALWSRWVRPANLALGMAATVAMWTLSYVALLQPGFLASELLFAGCVASLLAAGWVAGRHPSSGACGWRVGLVSATVNLMIVGAFLRDEQGGTWTRPALYVAGLFVASGALAEIGARLGARRPSPRASASPSALLAVVLALNILAMVVLGGLVTSMEAGLAVPDWPNSFGHNMLLYPISEMKGGIFYEHSHRLFGMLVGAVALSSLVTTWRLERRHAPRVLALVLLALIILQGYLGGTRVTGSLTTSMEATDLAPSTTRAIIHGMLGQFVFALSVVYAVVTSRAWASAVPFAAPRAARVLPAVALGALVMQLFLGASMRHLQVPPTADAGAKIPAWALHGHITMAIIAAVLVAVAGFRASRASSPVPVRIAGKAVMHSVGLQFLLGILALVAVLVRRGPDVPWWEVGATTAHQAVGALLLAATASLAALSLRFTAPAGRA